MIIIGEKLNGSIPSVAQAIARRDAEFIRQLATAQAAADANYLDCCASVPEVQEAEVLTWMIDNVQQVTDVPICVDSPSPEVLRQVFSVCKRPGILNSVSGEGDKLDTIFPLLAENPGWQVIALLSDDRGIPKNAADRLRVFDKIMTKAEEYGISPARLHIDPLIEMLCTAEEGIGMVLEVIRTIRERYPTIHITGAVSNVSFNLPVRGLINQAFLVLAMEAGMDSAVLDPTKKDLMGVLYATEAMLGLDEYCMEYIGAYRRGIFGTPKA